VYQTAFKLADRWPLIVGEYLLAVVLLALAFVFLRALLRSPRETEEIVLRVGPMALAGIPALVLVVLASVTAADLRLLQAQIDLGQSYAIEGQVTDFTPGSWRAKVAESFVVSGHPFSYSPSWITAGFNQTAELGGPIVPGLQVRITYVGDTIVQLETPAGSQAIEVTFPHAD
jgi:hypothetical protein